MRKKDVTRGMAFALAIMLSLGNVTTFTVEAADATTAVSERVSKADTSTMNVEVVDEQGNPFNDCGFAVIDAAFPTNEGMARKPSNGVLSVKITDFTQKESIVRVHKSNKDKYSLEPAELKLTLDKKQIIAVNGQPYDGTQTIKVIVKKLGNVEEKPSITLAETDKTKLEAEGGNVELTVTGKMLTGKLTVSVWEDAAQTDIVPTYLSGSATEQSFKIKLPENTTTEDKTYRILCNISDNVLESKSCTVTVAGKEDSSEDTENPELKSITATPNNVSASGGPIVLKAEGTGLTSKNWTAEATAMAEGIDFEMGSAKAESVNAESATLNIPENKQTAYRMVWHIKAGPLKNGKIDPDNTVETIVYQDKAVKTDTITMDPVEMLSDNTIVATFDKKVILAETNAASLRKLIYITNVEGEQNPYYLQANDEISISDNQMTITLENVLKLKSGATLCVEQGALKNDKDVLYKKVSWAITSNPHVWSIDFDKDVFDYLGGTATAKLTGVKLNDAKELKAEIVDPATMKKLDVPFTIHPGSVPEVTFTVPQNDTDKTQSYYLNFWVDGLQVHEGTSTNQARRAIVSVLPKGTDTDAKTLSSLTITGSTKVESDSLDNIEVVVPNTIGQLKTKLKLSGTNLDSSKTEVRAIDENGIVWPVYHVPE